MRRLIAVAASALLFLAGAGPATAGAYNVAVFGQGGWTITGIWVQGPMTLPIQAKGFVHTASVPQFLTHPATPGSGPAGQTWGLTCGEAILDDWYDADTYGPCSVADAYWGELVAKVGTTTWAVGAAPEITIPDGVSGILFLAANDLLYTYADNSGKFTITFR